MWKKNRFCTNSNRSAFLRRSFACFDSFTDFLYATIKLACIRLHLHTYAIKNIVVIAAISGIDDAEPKSPEIVIDGTDEI